MIHADPGGPRAAALGWGRRGLPPFVVQFPRTGNAPGATADSLGTKTPGCGRVPSRCDGGHRRQRAPGARLPVRGRPRRIGRKSSRPF